MNQYTNGHWGQILEMRVTGINVVDTLAITGLYGFGTPWFYPSVTNTGPQALYVGEILYRYWESVEFDTAQIPPELLTMVVSFDGDGNPVSSVDLSKYGLTMPVITLNPKTRNAWEIPLEEGVWQDNVYTVAFPDLAEPATVPVDMRRKSPDRRKLYSPIPKKSPAD
ncbi:MAG: hypothetical protein FWF84_05040 [Kiritimatiellaeota bacterium]|nr:hypothetical protein [Kiritimatiellota bacterium]